MCVSYRKVSNKTKNDHHDVKRTPTKLSICISTFKRAAFIGQTLDSILSQVTEDCEIVVSDNASLDGTDEVVAQYAHRFERLHYFEHNSNNGPDRNFDRAVGLANGEYCWLLSDDDPLKDGAVSAVLKALGQGDFSLILVNSEARDVHLANIIKQRLYDIHENRIYPPTEIDRFFVEMGLYLAFMSGYVFKRSIWQERQREGYYDSWFIFVGVIFQKPLPGEILVIAEPLVCCRVGNSQTFSSRLFEIEAFKWPSVVWSLAISEGAKRHIPKEPWRNSGSLLVWRGTGTYSLSEYERYIRPRIANARYRVMPFLIAHLPGSVANAMCMIYFTWTRKIVDIIALRQSRFYVRNWWF